jgi:hypothetical protein
VSCIGYDHGCHCTDCMDREDRYFGPIDHTWIDHTWDKWDESLPAPTPRQRGLQERQPYHWQNSSCGCSLVRIRQGRGQRLVWRENKQGWPKGWHNSTCPLVRGPLHSSEA